MIVHDNYTARTHLRKHILRDLGRVSRLPVLGILIPQDHAHAMLLGNQLRIVVIAAIGGTEQLY
ncbi:hypothetical protein D3C81_2147760 [compost metagenome]